MMPDRDARSLLLRPGEVSAARPVGCLLWQIRTIIICAMKMTTKLVMRSLAVVAVFALVGLAQAADMPVFNLAIKNHQFTPTQLKVPADTQFKLIVANQDPTPEEFESTDFSREKIVMPNSSITVFIGPLKAGTYKFFGDFHQETAQGTLLVE